MAAFVPTYDLYGEILTGGLSDPLHFEPIQERSSQHDWTIRVHRHKRLMQIFLFRSHGVSYQIGDLSHQSSEAILLLIPPGVSHGFLFPETIDGDVVSLHLEDQSFAQDPAIARAAEAGAILLPQSASPHFNDAAALMEHLRKAYTDFGAQRVEMLRTLARALVLYISEDSDARLSVAQSDRTDQLTPQERYADQFCAAVEAHFATQKSVAEYAALVGVSPPHLTRICTALLGMPPNQLVRRRRLLEAKRLLRHTRLSAAHIAVKTGFEDAPYFNRVFKSEIGMTPLTYRDASDV